MRRVGGSGQAESAAGPTRERINERIYELTVEHHGPFPTEFLCECGDIDCPAFITLSVPEYAELRAARRPILASGHPRA